jgi:hypothetical protein
MACLDGSASSLRLLEWCAARPCAIDLLINLAADLKPFRLGWLTSISLAKSRNLL